MESCAIISIATFNKTTEGWKHESTKLHKDTFVGRIFCTKGHFCTSKKFCTEIFLHQLNYFFKYFFTNFNLFFYKLISFFIITVTPSPYLQSVTYFYSFNLFIYYYIWIIIIFFLIVYLYYHCYPITLTLGQYLFSFCFFNSFFFLFFCSCAKMTLVHIWLVPLDTIISWLFIYNFTNNRHMIRYITIHNIDI